MANEAQRLPTELILKIIGLVVVNELDLICTRTVEINMCEPQHPSVIAKVETVVQRTKQYMKRLNNCPNDTTQLDEFLEAEKREMEKAKVDDITIDDSLTEETPQIPAPKTRVTYILSIATVNKVCRREIYKLARHRYEELKDQHVNVEGSAKQRGLDCGPEGLDDFSRRVALNVREQQLAQDLWNQMRLLAVFVGPEDR